MSAAPSNALFKALADETRREILKLLRSGPKTSGELADRFHSSWPTISRHLAVLREGGLVTTERKGQEIYYELNTSRVPGSRPTPDGMGPTLCPRSADANAPLTGELTWSSRC